MTDSGGQKLAYVYFEEEPGRRSAAKMLTRDEARRSQKVILCDVSKMALLSHFPSEPTLCGVEPQTCFVLKSGHVASGAAELREAYRATFSYKPDLKLDVRKIISAGDDIALAVVKWTSKTVSSSGEAKVWAARHRHSEKTGGRHVEAGSR